VKSRLAATTRAARMPCKPTAKCQTKCRPSLNLRLQVQATLR
jgi:hypothetical protein